MAAIQWRKPSGEWTDVLVPMASGLCDGRWPKAGAYPLIPYSNRISNASLVFQGHQHQLRAHPDAAPHTLHGHSQMYPWSCEAAGQAATMRFEAESSGHWPWRFGATQHVELNERGVVLSLSIENRDTSPMPAGLGWHPFFVCAGTVELHHNAKLWWPQRPDYVPLGTSEEVPPKFGSPIRLDGVALDVYLSGTSGVKLVRSDGVQIEMATDSQLDHLVVHYPAHKGYACIEPTSHVPNGFNLAEDGVGNTGRYVLAPGEQLKSTVTLTLSEVPAADR